MPKKQQGKRQGKRARLSTQAALFFDLLLAFAN
jgi:hypothetical protein